ncbi:MAG: TonB family protein, partial [Pseudoxanthomonas sp.]
MVVDALVWLIESTLAATLALSLVLVLRVPLRRTFGARMAYACWLLVPLAMLAVALPARAPAQSNAVAATSVASPTVHVGAIMPVRPALDAISREASLPWLQVLLAAWILGALLLVSWSTWQQLRFVRALGPLSARGDGLFVSTENASGPLVIGVLQPRVVLPPDFNRRYPPEQAALVVAHERAHLAAGDVRLNLLVVALRCLHWFNPLLHWAATRFRHDQEMACDAAVLARFPESRRAYADAMLKTQLAVLGLPVGCHWQSSQSLKERILMLKHPLPGRARKRVGLLALVAALSAGSFGAWALQPASLNRPPAYIGKVLWGNMANVDIRTDQKAERIDVSGGSMAQNPNGTLGVHMNGVTPLRVEFGDGPGQLRFEAQSTNTVSEAPVVVWTLQRNEQRIGQGRINLTDVPQILVVGGVAQGTTSSATLTFRMPVGQTLMGKISQPLQADASGRYVVEDSVLVGDQFKRSGSAELVLHVSPAGEVSRVEIEHVSPTDAFTQQDADDLTNGMRFRARIQDGAAVATLVRTSVHFAPSSDALENPPAWFRPAKSDKDVQAMATPAPAYPNLAEGAHVSGKVLLLLDVAADGSVSNVVVEQAEPAGVFDAAAVAAAKVWKFSPALIDGKPVAGRVRVPITFEAPPLKKKPGKAGYGVNPDGVAYDWIKYDPTLDKDIRKMECKTVWMDEG